MRISDWSSDVCSSDLTPASCSNLTASKPTRVVCSAGLASTLLPVARAAATWPMKIANGKFHGEMQANTPRPASCRVLVSPVGLGRDSGATRVRARSEEHTSELQSLMRISYAVFCLKKKNTDRTENKKLKARQHR